MPLSDKTTIQTLKIKIIFFIMALFALSLIFTFSIHKKKTQGNSAFVILTIGDDDMEMQHPQTQKRWPDYLQDEIDRTQNSKKDIVVLNRSFSFLNTYGVLKRLNALLEHDKPDHVLLQVGRTNKDNRYGSEYYMIPFWFDFVSSSNFEIALDDRDKYERNNPLYLKFNEAFDFCFNPELKSTTENIEKARQYIVFLQTQNENDEKVYRCLGQLYKNFLNQDSLAYDAFLKSWNLQKNPDLHYIELYQFADICGSSKTPFALKLKCLWSAPKYPSLFLSSKKVQEHINIEKKLCSWLEYDLGKIVSKLKQKSIGVTLVTYARSFEGEYCNPNILAHKVAESHSISLVQLEKLPLNQEALNNEQTAREVFKVLDETKVFKNVD